MKIPHPLNAKEQYLYALVTKLDTVIDLLVEEKEARKEEAKPAPRKAATKKKEV